MKKQGKSFANMHTEFKKAKAQKKEKKAIAKKSRREIPSVVSVVCK